MHEQCVDHPYVDEMMAKAHQGANGMSAKFTTIEQHDLGTVRMAGC